MGGDLLKCGAVVLMLSAGAASAGSVSAIGNVGLGDPNAMLEGSLDVVESFDAGTGVGTYNVTNNVSLSGSVVGLSVLGVSNKQTQAIFVSDMSTFDCGDATGNPFFSQVCYSAETVHKDDWATTAFRFSDLTYQDVFGAFETIADAGDDVFNIFFAEDGDLLTGGSIDNYFGFVGAAPASQIIGVAGGVSFTAGGATLAGPTTPGGPSPVPLPAAGWFLVAGLGGLAASRKIRQI